MKATLGFALLFAAANAEVKHVSTSKNLKVSPYCSVLSFLLAYKDSKRLLLAFPLGGLWQQRLEHRCWYHLGRLRPKSRVSEPQQSAEEQVWSVSFCRKWPRLQLFRDGCPAVDRLRSQARMWLHLDASWAHLESDHIVLRRIGHIFELRKQDEWGFRSDR